MDTKNKIVLLADDDDDDRAVFQEALSMVDSSIVFFSSANGCEALERLGTRGFYPDVIFMDVKMPMMDGMECLKQIKKSGDYKKIPVVMYTTMGYQKTKDECLELGANAYIHKPSSINIICDEIKNAFSQI